MRGTLEAVRESRLASVVRTRPIAGFFTLALAISWAAWIPLFLTVPTATSIVMIPGAFGPTIAAVAVMWLRGASVRAWLADGLDWYVGGRWYMIAVGLPMGLAVAVGAGLVVATETFETTRLAAAAVRYPVMVVFLALLGGGQEEFGWRGYALPALQERLDALTASVVIGVVWAIWHLPAFVFEIPGYTGSFVQYGFLVVGVSIVLTWLYNNTGGSVLLAMLVHGGVNAAPSLGAAVVGTPSTLTVSPYLLLVVPVWAVALALLIRYGRETLSAGPAVTSVTEASERGSTEVPA